MKSSPLKSVSPLNHLGKVNECRHPASPFKGGGLFAFQRKIRAAHDQMGTILMKHLIFSIDPTERSYIGKKYNDGVVIKVEFFQCLHYGSN